MSKIFLIVLRKKLLWGFQGLGLLSKLLSFWAILRTESLETRLLIKIKCVQWNLSKVDTIEEKKCPVYRGVRFIENPPKNDSKGRCKLRQVSSICYTCQHFGQHFSLYLESFMLFEFSFHFISNVFPPFLFLF